MARALDSPLKEAFEIEPNPKGDSLIDGVSHQAEKYAKDLLNVRGCAVFWSSVVAILTLLGFFTFYDRRIIDSDMSEEEFFREDHGFDIAAVSIADKLGHTLKVCAGGDYCIERIGLYARIYHLERRQLQLPDMDLKVSQDKSNNAALVSLNLPRTRTLERATEMDIFRSQDEGTFSGLVFAKRIHRQHELSDYGVRRIRPTTEQAISVAADLVVAIHAMHTKVKDYAILHCSLLPKNILIHEVSETAWEATVVNYHQALVLKLKSGDKIQDPIFTEYSEFKHCRGTDWDHWFSGKKPYSANVEWRQLGLVLYRLVEAGHEREMYDVFTDHMFSFHNDDCNYRCSAEKVLNQAKRLEGDLKEFVKWLILSHDTIEDESEVLSHKVFSAMPQAQGPMAQAKKINMIQPTAQFIDNFKSLVAEDVYRSVTSQKITDFPIVEPGSPYFPIPGTILNLEIFLDFTSPWCKSLFDTIAHHVAPAFKQKVNFVFQSAPQAHHPQAAYIHEIAMAVGDMGGHSKFWEFADQIFMHQDEFLDDMVYDKSRQDIHDKLIHMAGSIGIDNLMDLQKRVTGKLKWKVQQDLKFARQLVVNRGFCLWTPLISLNGDWVAQAGSSWEQEDWRQFFDYHVALLEDPENAGVLLQSRNPFNGYEGERTHGRSRQPLKPLGAEWPRRKPAMIQLDFYLDFSNRESKTIFEIADKQLAVLYNGTVGLRFQHVINRDSHASIFMHETAWAVMDYGGHEKFFEMAGILFKEQDKFRDDLIRNKSRHEIYQDLAVLSGRVVNMFAVIDRLQVVGKGNAGNKVTDHVMFADRHACNRGVHEAPRVFLNGVPVEKACAGWSLEDWKELLDKAVAALQHANEG